MFYFHDPLMNTVSSPVIPPAITRVVEAPASGTTPPPGWQWANSKSSSAVAPGTVAGGDVDPGKKRHLPSPSTPSPKPAPATHAPPVNPCSADSAPTTPAWQPPKGYILWTGHYSVTQTKAQPSAALPTWSIVSWKNLAPGSIAGTKKSVIAKVESDLAAAGVHHLDIKVYDAVHAIVALKAKT